MGVLLSKKDAFHAVYRGTESVDEIGHSLGEERFLPLGNGEAANFSELTRDKSPGKIRKALWDWWKAPQGPFPSLQQQFIAGVKKHGNLDNGKGAGHSLGAGIVKIAAVEAALLGVKKIDLRLFGTLPAFDEACGTWLKQKNITCTHWWLRGDEVPQVDKLIPKQQRAIYKGLILPIHGDFDLAVLDDGGFGLEKPIFQKKSPTAFSVSFSEA